MSGVVPTFGDGVEWLVDAHGCDPSRLRSVQHLSELFERVISEVGLKPLRAPEFHAFPGPGGVTGLVMLTESHLACHTFPETGFAAFNLYCCRERPDWPWSDRLAELLGATKVEVRAMKRPARGVPG